MIFKACIATSASPDAIFVYTNRSFIESDKCKSDNAIDAALNDTLYGADSIF